MSQTLSLQPGKYALFITPPVAGVDYTGTPLPTVSYQWKKNGTAIAGQTNATISGVWVEQTGGTVDLVDGDVISIDIILSNVVDVSTKTISATIDSAIPAPVISPVSIRQLSGGTYQTVTSLANTDIGEQVIVASNSGGTVTTTPPVLTTYQWRRNAIAIAGATAQTYTLQSADADSVIDCRVTAANSGGTTTATATVVVGTVADAGGWTALTPSADSRLIYVSNDGNDAAAANVKGRGYYLPSDPEIGPDPTNPVGPIVAYRNPQDGLKVVRGNGAPEWVLFRRGDTFSDATLDGNYQYWPGGAASFSLPGIWRWGWTGSQFSYEAGPLRGRSASEPFVITAWGNSTDPRPVINSGFGIPFTFWHSVIASLDIVGRTGFKFGAENRDFTRPWENVLIEDCRSSGHGMISIEGGSIYTNVTLRRCAFTNGWLSSTHNSGLLISLNSGGSMLFEECVYDRNGYKENPDDASTWTGAVTSGMSIGGLPSGTGVQPTRTYFDRNIYASAYSNLTLRGCIFSRDGGGAGLQMRQGGICERSLFMWNEHAVITGSNEAAIDGMKSAIVKDNAILHDDHLLPTGGWGQGVVLYGCEDDTHVADGNVVAHFHREGNGGASVHVRGRASEASAGPQSRLGNGIVIGNAAHHQYGAAGIVIEPTTHNTDLGYQTVGVLAATVTGNAVSGTGILSAQGDPSKPATYTYSGNRFFSPSGSGLFRWAWFGNVFEDYRYSPLTNGTFAQWQTAGYDTDGTFTTDFASFKAALGWTAPERDIVSYMQSVDPTYVVNEDVYVDEESSVKQAVRQKVWEVLADPAQSGIRVMSEAQAKLTARRYHAFITFIQRAKENRKGVWDTRWTAEAVNNYIREGFGKTPVTGPYDARSLETRILEYAS